MFGFVPAAVVGATSAFKGASVCRRNGVTARRNASSARVSAPRATPTMIATGEPLERWLSRVDKDLGACTSGIFDACKEIAYKIRTASCDKMSCFNDFGDEQLAIDVLADKVIFDNLEASGVVATASSEEVPVEKAMTPGGKYSVAFDPLDGSSIIDTNFSVGT